MATVSTQIAQVGDPTFTAEYMNNVGIVNGYREQLTQLRLARLSLGRLLNAKIDEIQSVIDSRNALVSQWRQSAYAMYPETQGQELSDIVAAMSDEHPLKQLWYTYSDRVNGLREDIITMITEFDDMLSRVFAAEESETKTLTSYADFAVSSRTQVPSVSELQASLISLEAIPSVSQQASLVASIPAIEMLDPNAAAMVMSQALDQGIDLNMAVQDNAGMSSQALTSKIKPTYVYVGLAGLIYWMLNGSSK